MLNHSALPCVQDRKGAWLRPMTEQAVDALGQLP
ncbi:hypothetical protein SMF913_28495 [Streptomyces malaysiensis]|uniref:Uncharacterized protein n=1 Tax=Streptomyces malaysiensis TaxID=92644 RepID=A0A291SWU8_STRMQ|nr:hypothetical protein SMALA_5136 [Streptomyces malaysiensis]PNG93030.1 hypothetical protein SMF913_28495 [Streptomyces malaysiensis]